MGFFDSKVNADATAAVMPEYSGAPCYDGDAGHGSSLTQTDSSTPGTTCYTYEKPMKSTTTSTFSAASSSTTTLTPTTTIIIPGDISRAWPCAASGFVLMIAMFAC